ncbi:MAG: ABC transporter ATP-binding protein [Clostridiales bacterium]|nr:ABC transporter ATP-binding protein [Clostridiales bacterium]
MGGRPGHGMRPVEKARDFRGTMRNLLLYLKPFRLSIIIVMIFALGSTVFSIVGPKILGEAITIAFEGFMGMATGAAGAGIDFGRIGGILLTLVVLYGVSSLFMFVQGYIMSGVAQKVTYNMRLAISEKINVLPLKYFDRVTHGEVLSRVTNDVDTVSITLSQSLSQAITSVALILGVLYMMFSISFFMTLVALVVLPVAYFIVSRVVKRSQEYFKQQQKYLGRVNGHVEEVYGGHVIVKAYNGEEGAIKQFDEYNGMLYSSAWRSQFLSGMMMPVMHFVGNLGYVAVSILGGYFAVQKAITVGDIAAFIQYMRSFTQPIAQVAQIANILQSTAAAAERVFEFISEEEEAGETASPVKVETPQGRVEFDRVRFGYSPDKIIIRDFSAVIEPGQRVAIVGPTGAGKTTIVKLLMRFYDVNSGSVKVEGHDVREYLRRDLRAMFGMVLQDSWLFNGTIMENIRYGRPDASDEEVIAAAKAAHIDHFIHTLPGGYQMELNEESSNISQGQKQLITIARAILADPHMLILDEATSSVDIRTEAHIQRAMERLMQGRTSFIIAHRLSTIKDADRILVMREGDIVEQGTHASLLAQNGFYASLYYSQFENPAAS